MNGAYVVTGTDYTMGSIVAQTAGVPINTRLISNKEVNEWGSKSGYLLPGACTLGDILDKEGYRQVFLIGSDGNFAGRAAYFRGHGNHDVIDYYAALQKNWIPADYYVWWGYEDCKLIEFAKKEILELAQEQRPFNFTMLTADTHFPSGYVCELCNNDYKAQYSNVLACSNRQIASFVSWIMQQDFYINTTIILSGDHPTMDYDYINAMGIDQTDRKTYVAVINAPVAYEGSKTREYTVFDLYPTTLAALGVEIEGNRLGLGVNLFSDVSTLYEDYGMEYLNRELLKHSTLYEEQLLYK